MILIKIRWLKDEQNASHKSTNLRLSFRETPFEFLPETACYRAYPLIVEAIARETCGQSGTGMSSFSDYSTDAQ